MKKLLTTILALTLALSLVACGGKNNTAGNNTAGNDTTITENTGDEATGDKTPEVPETPDVPETPAAGETPDLNRYYEDFMASLGENNAPAMMDLDESMTEAFFPGLNDLAAKQSVKKAAAITMVSFEFILLELENEADVETAKTILQGRVDSQVEGGAFYPDAIAAWEKAEIVTNGNVVALIVAGEQQTAAVDAFNALFA